MFCRKYDMRPRDCQCSPGRRSRIGCLVLEEEEVMASTLRN
ncbi:hypothetical protein HMPREF9604_00764 [Cutibacterium acnes HL036PA1]|nr:hypothetical protein HMPREF9604_00764 [Cutibacterium acnes HL036PA1]